MRALERVVIIDFAGEDRGVSEEERLSSSSSRSEADEYDSENRLLFPEDLGREDLGGEVMGFEIGLGVAGRGLDVDLAALALPPLLELPLLPPYRTLTWPLPLTPLGSPNSEPSIGEL